MRQTTPKPEISLGQANYEAFSSALETVIPGPWSKLPAKAQAAWHAAAQAVLSRKLEQIEASRVVHGEVVDERKTASSARR